MNKIFETASNVSTPLALAGFFAAVFFLILRQVISKIPKEESHNKHFYIIVIRYLFVLSIIAMVLGFIGWIYNQKTYSNNPTINKLRSIMYKVDINSSLETVKKFESNEKTIHLSYNSLPQANECDKATIKYFYLMLNQSNIKNQVYSYLKNINLDHYLSDESYIVYEFSDKNLVRISLRLISSVSDFNENFLDNLLNDNEDNKRYFNKEYKGLHYCIGPSTGLGPSKNLVELIICNDIGYSACTGDWWNNK